MVHTSKQILTREWGNWLGKKDWDFFTTVTYKHYVNPKRNYRIMTAMEQRLKERIPEHNMFWVMERSHSGNQTHNHLLLRGEGIEKEVNQFLKEKRLVNKRFVKHYEYQANLGANHYITKHITSDDVEYNISF